mmetsp:Transcript_17106/g.32264  ORF Transcript_17106/g.32264 Transcript_17106/m.32264 type:complete len:198 (+) Transcript_17106:47-640(+)
MDAAATTASTANSKTYGTLFGVRYVRGSGVLRLAYVTLTSLALSVLRVIIDFALGLALVQDSSWLLLVASLVDLALNAQAAAAGRFAVTHPSPGGQPVLADLLSPGSASRPMQRDGQRGGIPWNPSHHLGCSSLGTLCHPAIHQCIHGITVASIAAFGEPLVHYAARNAQSTVETTTVIADYRDNCFKAKHVSRTLG